MTIIPDRDDVIYFLEPGHNPAYGHTATHAELATAIGKVSDRIKLLVTEGVECRYLSAQGGGWKKGRTRLVFAFEEDEPEAEVEADPVEILVEDNPRALTEADPVDELIAEMGNPTDNPPENINW